MLTKYNRAHISSNTGKCTVYQVPADFNQTPRPNPLTWDHYLLDEDILRIMSILYRPKPNQSFAYSDCHTKHCHFSPPYSQLVHDTLGFSNDQELDS